MTKRSWFLHATALGAVLAAPGAAQAATKSVLMHSTGGPEGNGEDRERRERVLPVERHDSCRRRRLVRAGGRRGRISARRLGDGRSRWNVHRDAGLAGARELPRGRGRREEPAGTAARARQPDLARGQAEGRSPRPTHEVRPATRGGLVVLQLYLPERFGWWPVQRAKLDARSTARFQLRTRRRVLVRVVLTLPDGATVLTRSRTLRIGPRRRAVVHHTASP